MRGLSDLDSLCLSKIFKHLRPLDLCSIGQCSRSLRYFVYDHLHSRYFVREELLDLTAELHIGNVNKVLKYYGKFVRHLKVRQWPRQQILTLDVIANNCSDTLRSFSLINLKFYEIDMQKFARVFVNLEILELIDYQDSQKCVENFLLGHEYPNLTTLRTNAGNEVLCKFFMRKRRIKKLICRSISDDLLPLLVLNARTMEELEIWLPQVQENVRNVTSVAQLIKLKRLKIGGLSREESYIALMRELSFNTELQVLKISVSIRVSDLKFNERFFDALSHLTNLKELRLEYLQFKSNDTRSIELMCRKLSKLESLWLTNCPGFPYRNFLTSACKSDKFRMFYVSAWDTLESNRFVAEILKDFIDFRVHRCFVSGNPLCIYLHGAFLNGMKGFLTEDNLKSIEIFGNIKIFRAHVDVFPNPL